MLNIVTAFDRPVPHMGQLLHESVHVIDTIRAATPVAQGAYPINHAVFRSATSEDVIILAGNDNIPVVRIRMEFDLHKRSWNATEPVENYIDQYLSEVRSQLRDPTTH